MVYNMYIYIYIYICIYRPACPGAAPRGRGRGLPGAPYTVSVILIVRSQ